MPVCHGQTPVRCLHKSATLTPPRHFSNLPHGQASRRGINRQGAKRKNSPSPHPMERGPGWGDGGRLQRTSVLLDIVALTVQEILDEHIAKKLV